MTHMFPPRALQFKMRTKLLDLRGLPQQRNWLLEVPRVSVYTRARTRARTQHITLYRQTLFKDEYIRTTILTPQKRMVLPTI